MGGAYFITICTKNREHFFGEIDGGEMKLSEIGRIAEREWQKTFDMRPDINLQIGEYQIMPNHFHAIIIIGENEYNKRDGRRSGYAMHCVSTPQKTTDCADATHRCTDAMHCVCTKNQFGPQSKNLASIIRGFKIGVTTNALMINPDFAWQHLYLDHIIRDEQSFRRIQIYIRENPAKWADDDFYDK